MSEGPHRKTWKLSELASHVTGSLEGDGAVEISGLNSLEEAGTGELTFVANRKYLPELAQTKASAVILPPDVPAEIPAIRSQNPYLAFARIATLIQGETAAPRGVNPDLVQGEECRLGKDLSIHPRVVLGNNVTLGDRVTLHPGVIIGDNSVIGDDALLYANVSVRENCRIGRRVILHCGVVIGSDGFGFAPDGKGYYKVPQAGGVVIEDDVEIGANSTVDRGTLGNTIIRKGAKIDNLVMVAHNVEIGENSIIVSQVGISGSTKIGNHVTLAGQVGVAGHLTIGDNVMVGAQSGITRNLAPGKQVSGLPVIEHKKWLKAASSFEHLPQIRKAVRTLQDRIEAMLKDPPAASDEAGGKQAPGTGKPEGGNRMMDINEIMEYLPHRYPFLLVDRIIEIETGKRIVGLKNVTHNEPFFQGHFPGHPIMPGVLIIEAMAQTAGVLSMQMVDDPSTKVIYFMSIDRAKFRQPVVPGDQLRLELEVIKIRVPIMKFEGRAYVEDKKVAEAVLTATIADK